MINLFITIQIRLCHYHMLPWICDQIYCPIHHGLVPRTEGVQDYWFPYGRIYHVIFYPRYIRDPMSIVPDETLYQERTRKIFGNKDLVKIRQPENNLDLMIPHPQ